MGNGVEENTISQRKLITTIAQIHNYCEVDNNETIQDFIKSVPKAKHRMSTDGLVDDHFIELDTINQRKFTTIVNIHNDCEAHNNETVQNFMKSVPKATKHIMSDDGIEDDEFIEDDALIEYIVWFDPMLA